MRAGSAYVDERVQALQQKESQDVDGCCNSPTRALPEPAVSASTGLDGIHIQMYITIQLFNLWVMKASERLDLTFAALADSTRRAILARLAKGEATVMELAEPFDMSQPAISKHLKVLERAGLVSGNVDAQRRPRKLETDRLEEAVNWIERYRAIFEQNYLRLDALLDDIQYRQSKRKRTGK